jgi:transposase
VLNGQNVWKQEYGVQILDMSNKISNGKMSISKLAKHFQLSRNTITKYISGLERQIVGRESLYDLNEVANAIKNGKKNKRKSKR